MTATKTKAKASSKAKAAAAFDPRSEAVVLAYTGTDEGVPSLLGIPARDLTQADISRLVYAAAVNAYDGTPESPAHPDPDKPDQKACGALVELLRSRKVDGTALYVSPKSKAAEKPAETPAEPETPAMAAPTESPTPAETPAEPEA